MKYRIVFLLLGVLLSTCDAMARDTLRFGRVRQGDTARDTLRIENMDLTALMISNPRVSNPAFQLPAAPFTEMPAMPLTGMPPGPLTGSLTIEPNGEGFLPISFIPDAIGNFIFDLILDTNRGLRNWVLSGKGVEEVVAINEVLADPPSGSEGDANGDGTRNSNEDEFVEILNTGLRSINISGWQLSDSNPGPRGPFTFSENTWIDPGEYIVLFGGGTPTEFAGQIFVDDGKIGGGLSNSGDAVFLINPALDDTLARAEWGSEGGDNQFLVRYPEGIGAWVLHSAVPGTGERFSPGRARALRVQRRGDLNSDDRIDVLDAVRLVHLILGISPESTELEMWSADMDQNGTLDIRDLIGLIAQFTGLSSAAPKMTVAPLEGWWWETDRQIWMQTNMPVHVGKMSGENSRFEARDGMISAASELDFVLGSADRNGFGDAPHPLGKISGSIQCLEVYTLWGTMARLSSKPPRSEILSSFPNPFNPDTVIEYEVAHQTRISLIIFSLTGQEVIRLSDQVASPGRYRAVWNGRDAEERAVGSGVYIARLSGANFHATRKLVLLK